MVGSPSKRADVVGHCEHLLCSNELRVLRNESKEKVSKKLFVGGLAWATTEESLLSAFSKFGPVQEAKVILDRETGRSRGFGFVTFADNAAGEEAIGAMDGAELDGRRIRVNEAEERQRRGPGGGGGDRGGGGGGGYRGGRGPRR